jgi:hypothetical protein
MLPRSDISTADSPRRKIKHSQVRRHSHRSQFGGRAREIQKESELFTFLDNGYSRFSHVFPQSLAVLL